MVLTSVDLPAPLSPTRATTSPAWTSKSMSLSACTAPKRFETPDSDRTAVFAGERVAVMSVLQVVRVGRRRRGGAVAVRPRRPLRWREGGIRSEPRGWDGRSGTPHPREAGQLKPAAVHAAAKEPAQMSATL